MSHPFNCSIRHPTDHLPESFYERIDGPIACAEPIEATVKYDLIVECASEQSAARQVERMRRARPIGGSSLRQRGNCILLERHCDGELFYRTLALGVKMGMVESELVRLGE